MWFCLIDSVFFDRQIKCIGIENTRKLINYTVYTKNPLANKILKNCGVNINRKGRIKDIKIYNDCTIKLVENFQENKSIPEDLAGALIAQLVISEYLFGIDSIKIPIQFNKKIKSKKSIIIGAGGLGNPVSYMLNKNKIPFVIIDDDVVDKTNIARQFLFTKKDIGKYKVNAIEKKLKYCKKGIIEKVTEKNLNILDEYETIYLCVDNIESRLLISNYALKKGKKIISAGVEGQKGMILKNFDFDKYVSKYNNDDSVNGIVPSIVILTGILQAYMLNIDKSIIYMDFYTGRGFFS
ncbi:ThiF family adenylyltransferase [Marinitoga aeolica]|uniref:ThiF family adenylyltransferase n=1 Tax=Marinitoga aeolica TaxID=2809031 RepID=A0ABY8PSS0_9BACT|nr:ThiF family adenylyltransferase [Marinitoga aeolica]WGS65677.1 ThiF family adenylyltransferase [Marinitoga aeolica]